MGLHGIMRGVHKAQAPRARRASNHNRLVVRDAIKHSRKPCIMQISYVYIMLSSNGLTKIGKSNNVDMRRWQLEQTANMFNIGERIKIRVVKCYPMISETVAFALEAYLHEYFNGCQAGTVSKEVFIVDTKEVIKIADTWHHAFTISQTLKYEDNLFTEANEDKPIDSTFNGYVDGYSKE